MTEPLLTEVPAAFHGRVNDVLLTGLALAVAEWRRERGRPTRPPSSSTSKGTAARRSSPASTCPAPLNWFTSIYPVRLDAGCVEPADVREGGQAMGTALKRVKEQLREIPDNGIGYGLLRHLNPAVGTSLAAAHPQIAFNYLGRSTAPEATDWGPADQADSDALGTGQDAALGLVHAIEVNAHTRDLPGGPELSATWTWAGDLFDAAAIEDLAGRWYTALRGLVAHVVDGTADGPVGGFTPSDLSLVDVSQDEIDELAAELDGEWELD